MPSTAGSEAEPGTACQGTPAAAATACSHAAISARQAASSAAAPLTVIERVRCQPVFWQPGWPARQMIKQPGESGGVGGPGQPGRVGERRVDSGHAAQRVQRRCRLVQARVQ